MSFIARSMRLTVYGLFVSGLTHFSATVVAMSLNMVSICVCLSLSDTWSSPFARICPDKRSGSVKGYYNFDGNKTSPGKHTAMGHSYHLFTDFCQIVCPKSFGQIVLLCHLTLGHIDENRVCLQNLIQVFLSGGEKKKRKTKHVCTIAHLRFYDINKQ